MSCDELDGTIDNTFTVKLISNSDETQSSQNISSNQSEMQPPIIKGDTPMVSV